MNELYALNKIFDKFKNEQVFQSIKDVMSSQKELKEAIRHNIDDIAIVAIKSGMIVNKESIDLVKMLWSPELNWNLSHIPELKPISTLNNANVYGIIVRLHLKLMTSLEEVVDQFVKSVNSLSKIVPNRLIKCDDEVFLKEFFERYFLYRDGEDKDEVINFIQRRFDVEFLDYSDEYYNKGYFDIHHAYSVEQPSTTVMALIDKRGNVIHKGDCVMKKID